MIYRLDLTLEQYENIKEYLTNDVKVKKIESSNNRDKSRLAAKQKNEKRSKEKILNAINILRMENKKITAYSVSKTAEISFVTAKKYLDML